ncbi:MAG: hypothetical protein LBT79_02845 [Elusimicrobiota bacterium]|jgi:hypothetical protein|nr:hypothetical protein [Elusimicrobiota bacterium]
MKILKISGLLIVLSFILTSCWGISYHKETLVEEVEALIKKEIGIDTKAYITENTIYLDIELEYIPQKQEETDKTYKSINEAFAIMRRSVLSSDSDIKYLVATSYPKNKEIMHRIGQSIDDFKAYHYKRISRDDFFSRSIVEIEGPQAAPSAIEDRHSINPEEFAGRLIVSAIMADIRSNPFFAASISNAHLRFLSVENNTLYLSVNIDIISQARQSLESSLLKEGKNFLSKYEDLNIKYIKVTGNGKFPVLNLPLL